MIDIAAIRRVVEAPPACPAILGDNVAVSRDFLRQVVAELEVGRARRPAAR